MLPKQFLWISSCESLSTSPPFFFFALRRGTMTKLVISYTVGLELLTSFLMFPSLHFVFNGFWCFCLFKLCVATASRSGGCVYGV
ncbi:hypothetical protein SLE2022_402050 [Rubroshorea leprosula]